MRIYIYYHFMDNYNPIIINNYEPNDDYSYEMVRS